MPPSDSLIFNRKNNEDIKSEKPTKIKSLEHILYTKTIPDKPFQRLINNYKTPVYANSLSYEDSIKRFTDTISDHEKVKHYISNGSKPIPMIPDEIRQDIEEMKLYDSNGFSKDDMIALQNLHIEDTDLSPSGL